MCVHAPCVCLVLMKITRGDWIPWDKSCDMVLNHPIWVLGITPSPLQEQQMLLITEPSHKPNWVFILLYVENDGIAHIS